jgi:hypothetical protein
MKRPPKRRSRAVVGSFAVIAFGMGVTSLEGKAGAQTGWPEGLIVDWQAPPACPDLDYVRGRIASILSAPARSTALARPTAFRARVVTAASFFRLEVQTTSAAAAETKVVDAERCEIAAEAFALIVAFAVDPASSPVPPAPEPTVAVQPTTPPPPFAAQPAERGSTNTPPASSSFPLGVGPIVTTGVGVLPAPAFAVGGAISLGDRPRWEIEGRYWPVRQTDLATDAGPGGVRVSLLAARLSACLPWSADGRFSACLGAEIGRMRGEGVGVTTPDLGDSWWAAPSAGVAARLPVAPHFDVRVRLDVGVPLFRPTFTIQHADVPREVEGFRPPPVFAVLTLAPEVVFFATEERGSGHP